ncbi:MAG: hypothetical protein MZV64_23060 [Ignavibacteriales bacterium]|nr:hypothetical protein [Ignavibacteriales bacterium]
MCRRCPRPHPRRACSSRGRRTSTSSRPLTCRSGCPRRGTQPSPAFLASDPTTTTCAPINLAICTLAVLTPPPAPMTRTVSPPCKFPRLTSECHAVW